MVEKAEAVSKVSECIHLVRAIENAEREIEDAYCNLDTSLSELEAVKVEWNADHNNSRVTDNMKRLEEVVKEKEQVVKRKKEIALEVKENYNCRLEEFANDISVASLIFGKGKLTFSKSLRLLQKEVKFAMEIEKSNDEMLQLQLRRDKLAARREAQRESLKNQEKLNACDKISRLKGSERMKRNLQKLKARTEMFEIKGAKSRVQLEKEKEMKVEFNKDVENTFTSQTAVSKMAGKRLEEHVTRIKESRAESLCVILVRILDECRSIKAAGRIKEVFKKIKVPVIIKKSKGMLAKQQLRNWLRLANRFIYIDKGMPVYHRLRVKLRVWRKWMLFLAYKFKHETHN